MENSTAHICDLNLSGAADNSALQYISRDRLAELQAIAQAAGELVAAERNLQAKYQALEKALVHELPEQSTPR
jgi:hypothetical protein